MADINGRAAFVECYLPFDVPGLPSTERWTSYKKQLNAYPGELSGEGSYAKALSMTFDLITPRGRHTGTNWITPGQFRA